MAVCFAAVLVWHLSSWSSDAIAGPLFSDVSADHPYAEAISDLADRGIIIGFVDGKYRPSDPVTRQQLAKMIVLAMGITVTEQDSHPYPDVSRDPNQGLYPYGYVAAASRAGLVTGYTDGLFRPLGLTTRMQLATIVVRAAETSLAILPSRWRGLLDYSDPSHGENLRRAEFGGLLKGIRDLQAWDTTRPVTRGELAQILANLLAVMDHSSSLNVTDYGAVGDGVTDDTGAIQRAIDAWPAKGTVVLPAGTFRVNSTVYLKSGITITGAGPGQTILYMPRQSSPTAILLGSGTSGVTVTGLTLCGSGAFTGNEYGISMAGAEDCTLSDLHLDDLRFGIKLGAGNMSSGWTVSDIVARDCRVALFLASCRNSTFTRLDLHGEYQPNNVHDHTVYIERDVTHCTFTNCTFSGGAGWALQFWGGENGATHHLTFNNTTVDATEGGYPIVVGGGFSDIALNSTTIYARSNTTEGDVIRFYGGQNIIFDGFTVTGGRTLALIGPRAAVSGVVFKNGTFDGLRLGGGKGVTFENVQR